MKKTRKILLMAACAVLLVCISVGATVAYLTSTDSVTNTFTVGKIAIKLDEAEANPDGSLVANADRVKANEYKLMPGHEYKKDPTVHVTAGSEDCYLFVDIRNGIADIEAPVVQQRGETKSYATILGSNNTNSQVVMNGWKLLKEGSTIYYRDDVEAGKSYQVFWGFAIKGDVEAAPSPKPTDDTTKYIDDYTNARITITAYAVQKDGFSSALEAWNATYGKTNP